MKQNVTLGGHMEEDILLLFPETQACRLRLQFKYRDSFVGTIVLETNGGMQVCKYSLLAGIMHVMHFTLFQHVW